MEDSIGGVETGSMALGFDVTDAMLKAAKVRLLTARTICPGKYMVLVAGQVADVAASVKAGAERSAETLVDSFTIPHVHPDVFPAIEGSSQVAELQALGIIETFSVASLIDAADACAKAALVKLVEIKLAMAMGGKALVTFTGTVAAVEAAAAAGAANAGEKGLLVRRVVIPQPRPELLREII